MATFYILNINNKYFVFMDSFIANSIYLTELNLDGNLIGDLGGLEIRDGLIMRKAGKCGIN